MRNPSRFLGVLVLLIAVFGAAIIYSAESENVTLTVGRSMVLDTGHPIARVSLTSADIADAMVTSASELLINGKTPGAISMFVWDRAGSIRRYEVIVQRDLARLGALDGVDHLIGVDAAKHVIEDVARNGDDRDADHNPELMQDLLLAQKRDRPAYCFQHLHLELRFCDDGSGMNPADATLLPRPSGSAF